VNILKQSVKCIFNAVGLDVRRKSVERSVRVPDVRMPVELNNEEKEMVSYVKQNRLSMTSDERLWTTVMACKHVINRNIDGDFVECGVWRGGNAMLAASIFKLYKSSKRVYLFDTFSGMTKPTYRDRRISDNGRAMETFIRKQKERTEWAYASVRDVTNNFIKAGLLSDNVIFVQGDVITTLDIDQNLPTKVSVLRLDTDWNESTKKELDVLYPRLSIGGVLIIDDYGHWAGSKEATDEFFAANNRRPFLQYTDNSGRTGIKFE
jgi:O-methyltransferase